jgi:DNA-directed RNA polymerase beta subunit
MTYHGHIKDGVVILNDAPFFPDGTEVQVQIMPSALPATSNLGQRLMKYAGKAEGLPTDLARNHDHYIHGTPLE